MSTYISSRDLTSAGVDHEFHVKSSDGAKWYEISATLPDGQVLHLVGLNKHSFWIPSQHWKANRQSLKTILDDLGIPYLEV